MYESFFKLEMKPFELLPNPTFLYLSKSHKRALTYLDYGMRERAGFILLTGDVGSGKTTIIRDLVRRKYDRVIFSKVFNTNVSFDQLIAMINDDFGMPVQGKDKVALLRDLNDFLIEEFAKGNKPTLVIDEAQNLSSDLLEEIRMLSNLETDNAKLLQIILVGQPELRKKLAGVNMLQLRQRMGINCHIQPLSRQETEEYIFYRLEVAGNRDAVGFSPEALDVIYKFSRGIPRLVNIICDFLMLAAFAEETTRLEADMVLDVICDLDFENQFWKSTVEKTESVKDDGETSSPAPVRTEDIPAAVQGAGDSTGGMSQAEKRFEALEKAFMQFQHNIENDMGRSFRLHQDNRTAVHEVYNMLASLTKDVARNSEDLHRLQEVITELADILQTYFSTQKEGKSRSGLLNKMLGG
ncbi:MAG TPA: XrtA/PEP-CTERM system-associated ATPase [Geobacteraceae bacterium]|nr:XrtA/PEP-CTERM system-associated ATPase [Geobacteraceae bacterium]